MKYGSFKNIKDAVNKFVFDGLINRSLSQAPPPILNIQQEFASFLTKGKINSLIAAEEAEKQNNLIKQRLNDALSEWRSLGLPAPVGYAENGKNLLTWKHPKYYLLTGYPALSEAFVEVYGWLRELDSRKYLLACVALLKLIGCNPIFITDGSRDEGIDCIGRVAEGPLRSLLVFVQSKTKENNQAMGKEMIYQEYGKYATLPKTDKYREYLKALQFDEVRDGVGIIYMIVSNGEFTREAQGAAKQLGILLRSIKQLAFFLSLNTTAKQLRTLQANDLIPATPDLSTNIGAKIHLTYSS